jgi:hypothetical protein
MCFTLGVGTSVAFAGRATAAEPSNPRTTSRRTGLNVRNLMLTLWSSGTAARDVAGVFDAWPRDPAQPTEPAVSTGASGTGARIRAAGGGASGPSGGSQTLLARTCTGSARSGHAPTANGSRRR